MTPSASPRKQSVSGPHLTLPVDERRDHVMGASSAPVTLLEYGDYQCPYCGEAYPIVKRLQESLGDQLRFVFRNFPLTQMHPQAEFGAELAESAGAHGKFWEMHDFVYENQRRLADPTPFFEFAKDRLRLDPGQVRQEVASHAHLPRIQEDFMGGVHSGVNGTPTFYVNGVRHDGTYEFEVLAGAIKSAARAKK
jgi:protein-disulfide isomerase